MAALATSPLTKTRPHPFSPIHFSKPLNIPSLLLKSSNHKSPKTIQLKINSKQKTSNIFSYANNNRPNVSSDGGIGRRILLSDVVVKRENNVFLGRKWSSLDIATAGVVLAMHLISLFAPFYFTWSAFWVGVGLYVITGLFGITLSYHRNLSHRSFKLPKWLEYVFAYCGVQALQGNPIDWVSTHRYHHQFCDSERDPHSPTEGFWYSHMSWLFDTNSVNQRCGGPNNVGDLEKQSFYKFIKQTYIMHPIALAVLLFALGGVPFLVWGMGVRIVWVFHITWLVNSACHVWGKQAWNTGDLSRNNWWVALLAFGEGWHNNHHAFEYSARHGLEWWQIDLTWYVVKFLQALGLASDVKLPNDAQKQRMTFNN
ncbi:palmitoyl-monogalactosyldiacylglycerol delta-7 desaturase, chloroplastic-like [Mercurialis annua]|uniref:palmitoyl-monogalactosyldiacylglycerol delta-7 desaturase, chloroplastic-like n=1 Tax=Mercurialis annua TaxID=3986 RepID=UPI0021608130|nr:palmitoyl-monogalactosyldiacylglycerol delta-7 desaturase, chloroplastic-like [Mercurialis annua]